MTNEKIIREHLRNKYQRQYPNSFIRDEFTGPGLNTRNDLFLVDDEIVISFEIKSNGDTLKRLRMQVIEYHTYSSLVVIAIDKKHLKKLNKDFGDLIDGHTLIYIYDSSKDELVEYIKASPKEYPTFTNLLWSSELLLFREGLKGKSKLPKSSNISKKMIRDIFPQAIEHKISKHLFLKRIRENPKHQHYKPSINDDNIKSLILEHQEQFNNYLKEI